jgi:hypothetical protein
MFKALNEKKKEKYVELAKVAMEKHKQKLRVYQ